MILKKDVAIVVDAYGTGALLAPALAASGIACWHVQSTLQLRPALLACALPGCFEQELLYDGDADLVRRLAGRSVRWVLAACEEGVELAARLAELLQVPQRNDRSHWQRWRNKYEMHEALAAAGVRSIRHARVSDAADVRRWMERSGVAYPVVIKPIDSAGSDNVRICHDEAQVAQAVARVLASRNSLLQPNRVALAQEYLRNGELQPDAAPGTARGGAGGVDVEYCVNTVSCDGVHRISEIIKVYRRRIDGAPVHDYNELQCPVQDAGVYRVLGHYIGQVLDALGIRHGVAHSELMVVDNQPVLLETAARLPGGVDLSAYTKALGTNQVSLLVQSLLDPQGFRRDAAQPRDPLRCHSSCVFLISDRTGPIRGRPALDAWRRLHSFHSLSLRDSGQLERTDAMFNAPGHVFLLNEDRRQLARDRDAVRAAEAQVYQALLGNTEGAEVAA